MPRFFIVESLDMNDDEKKKRYEGKFLFDYLTLLQEEPVYHYIRTERELEEMPQSFANSGCLYFMLSCHGNKDHISTSRDKISFQDFSDIFAGALNNHRFFLSSCFAGQKEFARALYRTNREMTSFVGSDERVFMEHTYPLWTTFLYMILAANCNPDNDWVGNVNNYRVKAALSICAKLYRTKMQYFWKETGGRHHVQEEAFVPGKFTEEDLRWLDDKFAAIPCEEE